MDETGSIVIRAMHLSEIGVKVGQSVTKGEQIGKTGASGKGRENGYSPHLHLSLGMIENGKYRWVNAEKWEMKTSLDEVPWDELTEDEQMLITDYANIFAEDSKKRNQDLIEASYRDW